jgi:hypothetical protein
MKRITGLAVFAAVVLMMAFAGGQRGFAAEKDIESQYKEMTDTLSDEGVFAFWRASYYLSKIGEDGVITLEEGLDDKDVLVDMACARRLLDIYKVKDDDAAKKYVNKAVTLFLKVAGDKTAPMDNRLIAIRILGTSAQQDKCTKPIAEIAANKEEEAAVRLAAAEAEYMLSGALTQKEFIESMLKSEDYKLRIQAAVVLFTVAKSEAAATVLQEYRDDASIEGLLANRLLKNKELRAAMDGMKGVDAKDITQKVLDDLQKEYDTLFKEAEDITERVKALRSYTRGMQDMLKEGQKPKDGAGGGVEPPTPPMMMAWPPLDYADLMAIALGADAPKVADAEKQFKDAMALIKSGGVDAFWEAFRRVVVLDKDGAQLFAAGLTQGGALEKIACAGALLRAFGKATDGDGKKYVTDAETVLWKIIKDEREVGEIRQAATDVLSKYGQPSNAKALLDLADTAFDPLVRLAAIRASYILTTEMRGKAFLREKLQSDDIDVKGWAVITLCEMADFNDVRNHFDAFRYEPTLRGKLIQQYMVSDKLYDKLMVLMTGPANLERAAQLKIEIERMKGEITERKQALEEAKTKAEGQLILMPEDKRAEMQKDINDIYNGVKTEGGEEEPANPEQPGTTPAEKPPEGGTTPPPKPAEPKPAEPKPPAPSTEPKPPVAPPDPSVP